MVLYGRRESAPGPQRPRAITHPGQNQRRQSGDPPEQSREGCGAADDAKSPLPREVAAESQGKTRLRALTRPGSQIPGLGSALAGTYHPALMATNTCGETLGSRTAKPPRDHAKGRVPAPGARTHFCLRQPHRTTVMGHRI